VGSFVRPERLVEAARAHKAGTLDADAFSQVQDDCIREIVAFQDDIGMPSISDGEFRRRVWSAGFTDAVEGMAVRAEGTLAFKTDVGEIFMPPSPFAEAKLRRKRRIVTDDYLFVTGLAPKGLPKATIASPAVMHFFLGPASFEPAVYADREAYFADLAGIYQEEIEELAAAGCSYLQLDDTALVCHCDAAGRAAISARGEDPDELADAYVDLINQAIAKRPDGMTVGLHTCRGNLKGAWMAEGGYEPIAERLFNGLDVDAFFLEYDTPRAGDFAPLRHLPANKIAVLGLVSTKTPVLESKDEIKRRIDEAARFAPLERLALSPQCGFSSGGGGGQVVTQDDTRRKLELVVEVAHEVWG
jgi:5-methyltetrahydropteroyltriglutamate--homocysteine methyltransferase